MRALTVLAVVLAAGCGHAPSPATLDIRNDQCATCRMVVSSARTASQIVAPYQDPQFFDDLGCLERFLAAAGLPKDARVFVADHRTGEWVDVNAAIFTKTTGSAAAMGSPFVAHATAASRDADAGAAGVRVTLTDVLPSLRKAGGSQ